MVCGEGIASPQHVGCRSRVSAPIYNLRVFPRRTLAEDWPHNSRHVLLG